MKTLLLALAVISLSLAGKAQTSSSCSESYKVESNYVYYSGIVEIDTTITCLHDHIKTFVAKLAVPNTKVTSDDEAKGIATMDVQQVGKFKTQTGIGSNPMTVKYSIKIEYKKGKYRYTFDNFVIAFEEDGKNSDHALNDLDKDKKGVFGNGKYNRVVKAMDAMILNNICTLMNTMKQPCGF